MKNKPPQITIPEPLLCRTDRTAAILGVSTRKIAEMASAGLLPPSYRLGGCVLYKLEHLRLWTKWDMPNLDTFQQLLKARAGK